MRCPFCSCEDTKVVDSRYCQDGDQVRRRRECLTCTERFTTYETAELSLPRIIKRDKSREVFDEIKLRNGLLRALEKRPVEVEKIDHVVAKIKRNLRSIGEKEISSSLLGDWIMQELRKLDAVAYIRFASVYRSFQDIEAFADEIANLKTPEVV